MQIEANFTIKVAYLKFQENLKRKSQQMSSDIQGAPDVSKLGGAAADDIYLQPNFEKHTNLFSDFKQF